MLSMTIFSFSSSLQRRRRPVSTISSRSKALCVFLSIRTVLSLGTYTPQGGLCRRLTRRGDLIKVIWHDGQGACLFVKRLERGRFVWPSPADGTVTISPAQLGYLLEGIDWRHPQRTWRPGAVG